MEEQILRYYLKVFSIISFILFIYIFYILCIKKIIINEEIFNIKKNQKLDIIIEKNILYENKLNELFYKIYIKIYNKFISNIHYGTFSHENNSNFINFIYKISQPSNIVNKITIVEGWSKNELNLKLNNYYNNIYGDIEYNEIIADTYFLSPDESFEEFKNKLIITKNNYFAKNKKNSIFKSFTYKDILTIGSLLEKEGLDNDDKRNIFSVIINRLNKKMKLQIDATVLYAITNGRFDLKRRLNFDDLKIEHPYNTYKIYGLPPNPISYVGLKTIELILENYNTDYLFYFYDSFKQKHIYSKNYSEHKRKLNDYRSKK